MTLALKWISKRIFYVKLNDCDDVIVCQFAVDFQIPESQSRFYFHSALGFSAWCDAHAMTSLPSATERSIILCYCWAFGRPASINRPLNISSLHVTGCESLIRKMLILDPNKRYTVEQIKRHPWMLEEAPRLLPGTIAEMPAEPNDQVLRFMSSLDINTTRTRQVRFVYLWKIFIYYLVYYYWFLFILGWQVSVSTVVN